MALKCVGKIEDFRKMSKEYRAKDDQVTETMKEGIHYAMNRQEVLGVPMFKQDFAYRLIKLNQIEKTMWGTDFIKNVYKMVEDLDEYEANNEVGIEAQPQNKEELESNAISQKSKKKSTKSV